MRNTAILLHMNGILLVDKPTDWTSHDVVAKIRGVLEREERNRTGDKVRVKVGHAGTLDPFATGLLTILIGRGTKHAQKLLKLDKTYEVEIVLGATSDTDDRDGAITLIKPSSGGNDPDKPNAENETPEPTETEVLQATNMSTGSIQQIPPQFSAIKKNGKRAYKIARKGEHIELEPREVTIYSIEHIKYVWPRLCFTTSVSSGTYIRSLARDIGKELGVGGYVDVLRRTKIGGYNVNASTEVAQLNYNLIQNSILSLE